MLVYMNAQPETNRVMISMRLDPQTLELLEHVQGLKGTQYHEQTRTWLVEYAVNRVYGDLAPPSSNGAN